MGSSTGEAVTGTACRSAVNTGVDACLGGTCTDIEAEGSGIGAGAEDVLVGARSIGLAVEVRIAPVSRLTSFGATSFPWKKSIAEMEGSAEGANGKISPWKESAFGNILSKR